MGINHFFVVLLALLCWTSAYASRALVDNNVGEKNSDSLKKTMLVDQKCSGGSGGCGGRPTCPGQGSGNFPGQCPGTCPGQGSGNCPGRGTCQGQCQGSCSGCVGCSSGCVGYVPICQIPCGWSQGNSGGGYAYDNGKWEKIEGPHGTHIHMVPTNAAMKHSGVHNEAHLVTNGESVKPNMEIRTNGVHETMGEDRIQSTSEAANEQMTHRADMVNTDINNEAHVHMDSTNGALTHAVDMGNNGFHNEAHIVTNGEPVKPNMETGVHRSHTTIGEDGTHSLSERTNEVFPPPTEEDEH